MSSHERDYVAINLANWNSRVPFHEKGYELHRFLEDPRHLSGVVDFDRADSQDFDTLYPVLGADAQSHLATALGARVDDNRELIVDDQQQTSVDGLYAIGDIVSALNQISVAVGHAAIAATAIHNRLPRNFREQA